LRTEFATMDGSSDESPRPNAFERSDADPRLLSALAIGVAIFLLAAPFLIVAGYPDASSLGQIPHNLPQPPQPRLQIAPRVTADRLHASEQKQLNRYSWIDPGQDVVSIPIERAMRLLSERGITGWPSASDRPPR
jgi:hypothetical protein